MVFDAKSGISGAGVEPSETSHFPNLAENIIPYQVTAHRHVAEMGMELKTTVSFTPHVIPSIRGILTTAHVFLDESGLKTHDEIGKTYKRFYEGKRFMRLRKGLPSLSSVRGTNFCDIGLKKKKKATG